MQLGAEKLERLGALLERAQVTVSVDDEALLDGLDGAARRGGQELGVLVDCDAGFGRTGVGSPEEAVELACAVATRFMRTESPTAMFVPYADRAAGSEAVSAAALRFR